MRTALLWFFSAPLLAACATTPARTVPSSGPNASPLWAPTATSFSSPSDAAALGASQRKLAEVQRALASGADLDNSAELFDCLAPGQCPTSWEDRAKRRASAKWACPASSIDATPRPTKGLMATGSQLVMSAQGRAEYHAQAGVKGDAGFVLSGCGNRGIIACIPAHRSVSTPRQSYDIVDDHLCLWAQDPNAAGP